MLYVWFLVPETKGRTLEEMDELFGSGGTARADEALKRQIEHEIGLLALLGEEPSEKIGEKKLSQEDGLEHKEQM